MVSAYSCIGTYTRADLAAALLYMQCYELARFGVNVALKRRLTSVVYAGSFVNWPLTRRILQESFIGQTLLLPLMGVSRISTGCNAAVMDYEAVALIRLSTIGGLISQLR